MHINLDELTAFANIRLPLREAAKPKVTTTYPAAGDRGEEERSAPPAHAEPAMPSERQMRLAGMVETACWLRDLGLSVGMLARDGHLITFQGDLGEEQVWSRGGYHRVFNVPNVDSLCIATGAFILLEGPLDDFDALRGERMFPPTLQHHADDGLVTRLYATPDAFGSRVRVASFDRWTLRCGVEHLDCYEHGGVKVDRLATRTIATAPDEFIDALLKGGSK